MAWFYETKGCTLFPDRGLHDCCLEHDRAYAEQTGTRWLADCALLECGVVRGYPWRAIVAFILLRLFGWVRWHWIRFKKKKAST